MNNTGIEVPCGNGLVTLIDANDFDLVKPHSWRVYDNGMGHRYARTTVSIGGPTGGRPRQYTLNLHRLIMGLERGDRRVVDHINHDGLDNRRENLRICMPSQNAMSQRVKTATSQFKGVSRQHGRWVAKIRANKQTHYLGLFDEEAEAAWAYDHAARRLHGEFAVFNFGDDDINKRITELEAELARLRGIAA